LNSEKHQDDNEEIELNDYQEDLISSTSTLIQEAEMITG